MRVLLHLATTLACMASAALAAGCATPYQPLTPFSLRGGYVDERLSQDIFFVGFYGNGVTDAQTPGKYVLYRCAELAEQAGAGYFMPIAGDPTGHNPLNLDIIVVGIVPVPIPVHRPFSTVAVRLLHERPNDSKQQFFETKEILKSLR
jgi:hypothetical protein